jgi:hypothetical protein
MILGSIINACGEDKREHNSSRTCWLFYNNNVNLVVFFQVV